MGSGKGRQCIFCPNKADSQEHIWSQWILDLLPEGKDGVFVKRFPDGSEKSWPTPKPELTVGVVCERCNNGWMSAKLEGPMKEATANIIIHNNKKTFSGGECDVVAAWAFKTMLLANHSNPHTEPIFSTEQRRGFAHDLTIPKGVQIWTAKRNAGYLTARYTSELSIMQPAGEIAPHLKNLPVSPYRFQIYVCVFSIGYLLLQITAARWTERKVANLLNFPPIIQGKAFDDYAIPIWPNLGNMIVDWPPRRSVGNDMFDSFCSRMDKFNLPQWMGA